MLRSTFYRHLKEDHCEPMSSIGSSSVRFVRIASCQKGKPSACAASQCRHQCRHLAFFVCHERTKSMNPIVLRDAGSCVFLVEGATRRPLALSLHRKLTLHEMEAKRCHQVRTDFLSGMGSSTSWRYSRTPPKTPAELTSPREPVEAGSCWYARSAPRHDLDIPCLGKTPHERTARTARRRAVFSVRDCLHDGWTSSTGFLAFSGALHPRERSRIQIIIPDSPLLRQVSPRCHPSTRQGIFTPFSFT